MRPGSVPSYALPTDMDTPEFPTDGTNFGYSISEDQVGKTEMRFPSRARTVWQFTDRYAFFSIAIPYLRGRFTERILVDLIETTGQPVHFLHAKFDKPIFIGLDLPNGDKDWNHVLWAVEHAFWGPLVDQMCAATVKDRSRKFLATYPMQELTIIDPLFADKAVIYPAELPVLKIGCFGLKTNYETAYMATGDHPLTHPPRLATGEPYHQMRIMADAMFMDDDPTRIPVDGDEDDEAPDSQRG